MNNELVKEKKVSFFIFEGNYYVIPYKYSISEDPKLVDESYKYLASADVDKELEYVNVYMNFGSCVRSTITREDVEKSMREAYILSHDTTHLIATTDTSLGTYPTIEQNIIDEYNEEWDGCFMFPYLLGIEGIGNGHVMLSIREDSDS